MPAEENYVFVHVFLINSIPRGLVVRIRRSHRRGPGSIPGVGIISFLYIMDRTIRNFVKTRNLVFRYPFVFVKKTYFHTAEKWSLMRSSDYY